MKFLLRLAVMVVAGVAINSVSTIHVLKAGLYMERVINHDSWVTFKGIGSKDAGPMLRAAVATRGLFANGKEEAIYYLAYQGGMLPDLKADRHYQIKGNAGLPAKWWSITLYNEEEFLFDNPDNRYSFTNFNLKTDNSGHFVIDVSPVKPAGANNWLPAPSSGTIRLAFRIYQPTAELHDNIESYPLPTVREVL